MGAVLLRLEEHEPLPRRAARAVLVLRAAAAAVPVLPPDPLEMVHLEHEQREDPDEDLGLRHATTVAEGRATRNGPPGSSRRGGGPTPPGGATSVASRAGRHRRPAC